MSKDYRIITSGLFNNFQINIHYDSTKKVKRSKKSMSFINKKWLEMLKAAKSKKPPVELFNGSLASVQFIRTNSKFVEIETVPTSYGDYSISKTDEFQKIFPYEYSSNPLSAGALVLTSDNYVVGGIRGRVTSADKLTIPSGMADDADIVEKSRVDPFATIKREIMEEAGIPESSLIGLHCIGVVWNNQNRQTYLPFVCKTILNKKEVKSAHKKLSLKLKKKGKLPEFTRLEFIENKKNILDNAICENQVADIFPPSVKTFQNLFLFSKASLDSIF